MNFSLQPPQLPQKQRVPFHLFRDLLIQIKRKIKGKTDLKADAIFETPIKKHSEVDLHTTITKKAVETGHELGSEQQMT